MYVSHTVQQLVCMPANVKIHYIQDKLYCICSFVAILGMPNFWFVINYISLTYCLERKREIGNERNRICVFGCYLKWCSLTFIHNACSHHFVRRMDCSFDLVQNELQLTRLIRYEIKKVMIFIKRRRDWVSRGCSLPSSSSTPSWMEFYNVMRLLIWATATSISSVLEL